MEQWLAQVSDPVERAQRADELLWAMDPRYAEGVYAVRRAALHEALAAGSSRSTLAAALAIHVRDLDPMLTEPARARPPAGEPARNLRKLTPPA